MFVNFYFQREVNCVKNNVLHIYIDESGDFGFCEGSSMFYVVSFVFYDEETFIDKEIKYLNERLFELGHKGMVHTALLVSRKNEYNKWPLEKRKNVFYSLYNFARRIDIGLKSVIVDKRYSNNRLQLKKKLRDDMEKILNSDYINSFKKVKVYYDNGQDSLGDIIKDVFSVFDNVKIVSEFEHEDNRIFQVVDMLTVIDKLDYKIKNKISFNKSEREFFSDVKVKFVIKDFKNKYLK